jgi:hypothetical protein
MVASGSLLPSLLPSTPQARKSNRPRATQPPNSSAPFGALLTSSYPLDDMTRRQHKSQVSPRKHARYRMIVLSLAILSHPDPDEAHLHPSLPLAANCTVVPAPCDRAMGRLACSSQPIVGDVRRKLPFFSLRHNAISTNYTSFMPSWPATF